MFYCSASSSEKQDRTTVPTACSTVLPPLQRSKTGPRSPQHVLQFCLLFREARQDHSPHSMFYSSPSSSEKQDRTTVPTTCSTVLPSSKKQDRTTVPTACSTVLPSSKKHDRTTAPTACSTVLPPLQRSQKAAVAPWSNTARTAVGHRGRSSEDHGRHPNHWPSEAEPR